MAGLSDRSAFEAFDRMAERIEESERRALAAAEVSETLSGDTLEREFAKLQVSDDVDRRLLALKERLGLAAPSSATAALPSGSSGGTPEEALDCAAGLYLNDPTAWLPPTN